jgi:hypothetical protein
MSGRRLLIGALIRDVDLRPHAIAIAKDIKRTALMQHLSVLFAMNTIVSQIAHFLSVGVT